MTMPANHKVSVAWQIVALFVPIANFWAFYRIRKLRKYLLYVFVPSVVTSVALTWYISDGGYFASSSIDALFFPPIVLANVLSWGLFGFSIYLVTRWSREHNHKFDSSAPPQTSQD